MERTISDTLSWNSLGGNFPSGRLQRGASIQSDSMRHACLHALHIKSYQDIGLFLLCQQCHQGKKGEQQIATEAQRGYKYMHQLGRGGDW